MFRSQLKMDDFKERMYLCKMAPTMMIATQGRAKDLNKQLDILHKSPYAEKKKETKTDYSDDINRFMLAFGATTITNKET